MGGAEKIFGDMANLQNPGNKSGYERVGYNEFSDFGGLCGRSDLAERDRRRKEGSFSLHRHWLLGPINHEWDAPDTLSVGFPYTCLNYHRQSFA